MSHNGLAAAPRPRGSGIEPVLPFAFRRPFAMEVEREPVRMLMLPAHPGDARAWAWAPRVAAETSPSP